MSIASNLNRILNAKASIKNKIEEKGVQVPDTARIDTYASYIGQISGEGGGGDFSSTTPVGLTQDWATIAFGDNPKSVQFGTLFDLENFAASCATYSTNVDLSVGTTPRDKVLSMYIGDSCIDVPMNVLANPMKKKVSQFSSMQLVDFGNCSTIGNNVLSGNPAFNGEVKFGENLISIGDSFLAGASNFNHPLTIPDSCTYVGNAFCYACNNIPEIYVPESAEPPSDRNSLTCSSKTATTYQVGLMLKGPGASRWITALPNRDTVPYRNLTHIPDGKIYHRVRIQYANGQPDKVYVVEDGETISEPVPEPDNFINNDASAVVDATHNGKGVVPFRAELLGYATNADAHSVVLEYDNNEDVPYTLTVPDGELLEERYTPHKFGNRFIGWAACEPSEVKYWDIEVNYDNGQENKYYTIPDGEVFYEPRQPKKLGAKFLGWKLEE